MLVGRGVWGEARGRCWFSWRSAEDNQKIVDAVLLSCAQALGGAEEEVPSVLRRGRYDLQEIAVHAVIIMMKDGRYSWQGRDRLPAAS